MTEPLAVSVADAKRHLGNCSTATIYRMLERGELAKRKMGGRTLILMASIRQLLEAPQAA